MSQTNRNKKNLENMSVNFIFVFETDTIIITIFKLYFVFSVLKIILSLAGALR